MNNIGKLLKRDHEVKQKIKPGGLLLLDQGRSSGDFVFNFEP